MPTWSRPRTAAATVAKRLGFPCVVKPLDGNHGRGVHLDLRSEEAVRAAFHGALAQSRGGDVVVETYVAGNDYRCLVIGGKVAAIAERVPASVTGDGVHTVRELVDIANSDPRRGIGHEKVLTRIRVDDAAVSLVRAQGYEMDEVLPDGGWVKLALTGNMSTGGTSIDRTVEAHPDNVEIAETAARIVGLDVAGIDFICPDIATPVRETGGAIVEVNAAPGFRMHTHPTEGEPQYVARPVIDSLFPAGSSARIPIVAVTGTNGKTTTVRMISHILKLMGRRVGMTSTDGIVVDGRLIKKGDMSGPRSAQMVLQNPTVDTAVFEVARGGILREGLGYDRNDIAVVTNVTGDLRIGDRVTVDGVEGFVEEITLTYTYIRADDDSRLVVPNEKLASDTIHNATIVHHAQRAEVTVRLPLSTDVENVINLLDGELGDQREPEVFLSRLGDDATVTIRALADNPAGAERLQQELRLRAHRPCGRRGSSREPFAPRSKGQKRSHRINGHGRRRRQRVRGRRHGRRNAVAVVLVVLFGIPIVLGIAGLGATAAFKKSCTLSSLQPVSIGRTRSSTRRTGRCSARSPRSATASPSRSPGQPVDGQGRDRDRGPALLPARRRRLRGDHPRRLARREQGEGRGGRLDDHAAGRPQPLHLKREDAAAEDQGGLPFVQAEQALVEGADPLDVDEPGVLRQPRVRRRGRVADVLLEAGEDLTMMQAALLAGLPQAPSLYDPILFPDVARERRAHVLKAMYTNGDLSYDRYQSALQDTSLHLKPGQLY